MEEFFFIRTGKKHLKVSVREISCIEGYENYIKVYAGSKIHLVMMTMKEIEKFLPEDLFCRVHKSWIVGLSNVVAFDEVAVELKDRLIPIGKVYKTSLLRKVVVVNRLNEGRKNMKIVA
jgi:DNA-binding LytR/AlgR family response regulator